MRKKLFCCILSLSLSLPFTPGMSAGAAEHVNAYIPQPAVSVEAADRTSSQRSQPSLCSTNTGASTGGAIGSDGSGASTGGAVGSDGSGASTGGAVGSDDFTYMTEEEAGNLAASCSAQVNYTRAEIHDPSIVMGYYEGDTYSSSKKVYGEQNEDNTRNKIYFIFGTHRSFAWSTDLANWNTFTNNINDGTAVNELFEESVSWSSRGDSVYRLASGSSTNLWAPDVTWNPFYENGDGTKGAWMMYMSVNGCSWNSSIALLTSDSLNGSWTYQGTVIYSGFDNASTYDYRATDYEKVTGDTSLPSRYLGGSYQWSDGSTKCTASKWNASYGAHAIDPCIVFDGGDLWMAYGSWSGGIYMIKIDKATGLRDYGEKYELKPNVSDPYMGLKLAGGSFVSGEAPYIQKIDGTYYLFISNGSLSAAGGYNMRVFSSDTITGPYKDLSGDDARYAKRQDSFDYEKGTYTLFTKNEDNINGTVGNRLMSYYGWDFMNTSFAAQGHNSVLADTDGKAYVVYHSRYVNAGESYRDYIHQIFRAKNGGLVTAPFEYSGETLQEEPFADELAVGEYNILTMGDVNYEGKKCVPEEKLSLNADGTISGAYTGTWSQDGDGPYLTMISADGTRYEGVFIEQKLEGCQWPALCLSVVGNNDISIWGYRIADDKAAIAKAFMEFVPGISKNTYKDISLNTEVPLGVSVTWESSRPEIISTDGKVTLPEEDTEVILTAVFSRGKTVFRKPYKTTVYALGAAAADTDENLEAAYSFDNNDLTNEKNAREKATLLTKGIMEKPTLEHDAERGSDVLRLAPGINGQTYSYAQIFNPLRGKNVDGVTVSLWVNCSRSNVWGEIWSFYDGSANRLFLTQNAFFGYNNGKGTYFDCNNGATVTNALELRKWKYVTVTADEENYTVYIDGVPTYDKSTYAAYAGAPYNTDTSRLVLDLVNTAHYFYLGYGAFWGTGAVSVDNLKLYSTALESTIVEKLYREEKEKMESDAANATAPPVPTEEPAETPAQTAEPSGGTAQTAEPSGNPAQTAESSGNPAQTAEPSGNPAQTAEPSGGPASTSEPPVTEQENNKASISRGESFTIGSLKYKVTSAGSKKTVSVTGTKTKNTASAAIKSAVAIQGTRFQITEIGDSAFTGCKKLKTVTIGTSVEKIGKKAFFHCQSLKKITIWSKKLTSVGSSALKGIYKKASIKTPSSKQKTYKKLFAGKGQKKTVKIN